MRFKEFLLLEKTSGNVDLTQVAKLLPTSVSAKRSGRRGAASHIRLTYHGEDFEDFLGKHLDVSVEQSDSDAASGTFPTWEASVLNDITGDKGKVIANAGDVFYVVNNVSDKSKVVKKEFEPVNFGLNKDKEWDVDEIIDKVKNGLDNSKFDHFTEDEKDYLLELMEKVKNGKEHNHIKAPDSLNSKELKQLGINFGEILSPIWALSKLDGDSIIFPTNASAALIDFSIKTGSSVRGFSAKSGKGAAPSMKPIAKFIEDNIEQFADFPTEKIGCVLSLQKETVMNGFLIGNQILNTPGYKELERLLKFPHHDFTVEFLENWLRKFKTADQIIQALKPFSDVIKNVASPASIEKIINNDNPRCGIIISPFGYYLAKIMNNDDDFNEILNTATKSIAVTQVYTDITPTSVKITMHDFEESHFEWRCTINANNPNNNRMSFKMKK